MLLNTSTLQQLLQVYLPQFLKQKYHDMKLQSTQIMISSHYIIKRLGTGQTFLTNGKKTFLF